MTAAGADRRRLASVVHSWAGRPVLVLGDAMLDEWRFADPDRLCREAPAPVLTLRRRSCAAGGAANTAVNLAALGGAATLVSPVGADAPADELHDCLGRAGVQDRTVSLPGRHTAVKRRILAAGQILLREDSGGADDPLTGEAVEELLGTLAETTEELRRAGDGTPPPLVVCDYGLGALPGPVRDWLVRHRDRFGVVALDAHDLALWRGLAPTVVTPSFAEATRLLSTAADPTGVATPAGDPGAAPTGGEPAAGADRVELTSDGRSVTGAGLTVSTAPGAGTDRAVLAGARLAELRERTGAAVVAITLDTDGAIVGGADGAQRRSHSTPVPASHAVGAGDAYLAAMTLALTAQAPLPTAAQLAQLAATSTVTATGTCVCHRDDLLAALGGEEPATRGDIVAEAAELLDLIGRHRDAGRSVVFTNGCFDVLHPGHVRYLEQAAHLGDVLVVAVNADDSVRRLKGPDRPVNPVQDRVAVLAALSCVDHVVVFEEDSPSALIEAVRPDVYVKGGDYPPEMVPEAPLVRRLGGEVHTLGYVPDRSTSAIINRIRAHDRGPAPDRGQAPDRASATADPATADPVAADPVAGTAPADAAGRDHRVREP